MERTVLLARRNEESLEHFVQRMAATFAAQCPPDWWGRVSLYISAGGVSHIEILRTLKP